jgi:hypothetical protein
MSDIRFPASLKPIVSKGYSQTRGSNVFRTSVTGGLPRQGRDVYFEAVPFSITLLTSSLGRQAFLSFLNNIHAGADSFIMPLDSGLGIQDHQVMITSTINDSTDDGLNWTFTFTITAERTAIQEDTCLTANLPDLFGCYGDCLASFLKTYGVYQTTFPRIWSDEGPAGYPPINMQAQDLDGRIVYSGPSVDYLSSAGLLASSAVNEWPLQFFGGVAVGRVAPESAAENSLFYSQDFTNTANWAGTTTSRSTGTTSPSGFGSGVKVTPLSSGTSSRQIGQDVRATLNAGETWSFSAFAKASGYNILQFVWAAGATGINTGYINFDLTTLSLGNPSAFDAKATAVGNGWVLCQVSIPITGTAASKTFAIGIVPSISSVRSVAWTGDGTSGIELWAAQAEKGNKATSYIPSIGAAVSTRPAASASVFMNGATSIDITYSDASVVNVPAVSDYAPIPQANAVWGSKFITRIDFNV